MHAYGLRDFHIIIIFISNLFEALKRRCVVIGELSLCVVFPGCIAVFRKRHPIQYFWTKIVPQYDPITKQALHLCGL